MALRLVFPAACHHMAHPALRTLVHELPEMLIRVFRDSFAELQDPGRLPPLLLVGRSISSDWQGRPLKGHGRPAPRPGSPKPFSRPHDAILKPTASINAA